MGANGYAKPPHTNHVLHILQEMCLEDIKLHAENMH